MKRSVALLLVILLAIPAGAAIVEDQRVMYAGGSIAHMKPGAMGRLDVTDEKELIFDSAGGKLAIPYHDIRSFTYSRKLARRTGVLATAVVVLIKRRQRRHFIEVSFTGQEGTPQVAIFEVPKDAAQSVVAVLRTRAIERRAGGAPVFDCNRYPAAPRCRNAVAHAKPVQ
ncbi:MAG: hypothetical protein ACRD5F_04520 [Candidatus Acidiferrales bacterium]